MIESLVAVLLLLTIAYCILLNSRLKRLKSDEQSLKATISELITATEIAERAIAGLKLTVRDCDQNLGERLRTAERFSAEIADQLEAGEEILRRLTQIVTAARSREPSEPASPPDTRDMLARANAFAERVRTRVNGLAA
jgi:chromosome segregation ATPase